MFFTAGRTGEIEMQLPSWMRIGDKGTVEVLVLWGIPLMILIGLALAIWGSVTDNTPDNSFPF